MFFTVVIEKKGTYVSFNELHLRKLPRGSNNGMSLTLSVTPLPSQGGLNQYR
jgi:hypothetical protein